MSDIPAVTFQIIMQKRILRNTLTFLLGVFILVGSVSADNWDQWRGPNNDGVSQETDAPIQWSQTENVRWRLPLPGDAAATPVVWEDKIFLTSAEGNALVLMCINTEGEGTLEADFRTRQPRRSWG